MVWLPAVLLNDKKKENPPSFHSVYSDGLLPIALTVKIILSGPKMKYKSLQISTESMCEYMGCLYTRTCRKSIANFSNVHGDECRVDASTVVV